MYFKCSQPELLNAVQKVFRAVASNATLPALTGILLQAKNDKLTLQGTDLEIGIIFSFPVEVLTEGDLLLPARVFTEMVRKLPPTNLSIYSLPNNVVEIIYHQSKIQLNSFDPNHFPSFPAINSDCTFSVEVKVIKEAIRKVSIATNNEDLQSVFNAILLEKDKEMNGFNMVATDTHRLAVYHGQSGTHNENELTALIGNRAMNELAKLLPSDEGEVLFTIGSSHIFAQYNNLMLYARLVNGKFPHYRQVIPQSTNTTIKINTKDLLETTERATLLARDEIKPRSNIIMLKVEETLKVISEAAEIGRLEEELNAQIEGQALKIALNGRYLLETLRVIDNKEVLLKMQAPLKPIVVKPAEEDNYFCLILPVRIHSNI